MNNFGLSYRASLRVFLPASQVTSAYPQIAGKELTFGFKILYADLVRSEPACAGLVTFGLLSAMSVAAAVAVVSASGCGISSRPKGAEKSFTSRLICSAEALALPLSLISHYYFFACPPTNAGRSRHKTQAQS